MIDTVNEPEDRDAQLGSPAAGLTPGEQPVRFINSEVLKPPSQGNISFVKPFAEQVAVMALEDGRSFLQGVEQILLVAIAKALEQLLSGGAGGVQEQLASPVSDQAARPNVSQALEAAERMLGVLPRFHASLADTAFKIRENRP